MTYNAVKSILQQAQENQWYGNIHMTGNHVQTFHFEQNGVNDPDIITSSERDNMVGILGEAANCYIDCDTITQIVTFKPRTTEKK